mgnify:CR=1 FL=1
MSDAVRRARSGLGDPNRPIGSFLFSGPTGVGKTELTKALAEFLFDDEAALRQAYRSEVGRALREDEKRLVGPADVIARARRHRKILGGGLRQAGFLAAAASYALDHHLDRLADDHALAQRLATGLQGIAGLQVRSAQTNIVFVDLVGAAREQSGALLAHLAAQGIRATGLYRLRFVTHLDVDAAGITYTLDCIRRFFDPSTPKAAPSAAAGVY